MEQTNNIEKRERLWNSNYLKVWCANFMIFFSFMLLTPLLPSYLSDTFGADKQTIGIVLSGDFNAHAFEDDNPNFDPFTYNGVTYSCIIYVKPAS